MKSKKLIMCLLIFTLVLCSSITSFAKDESVTRRVDSYFDGVHCELEVSVSDKYVTVVAFADEPIDEISIEAVSDFVNAEEIMRSKTRYNATMCGLSISGAPLVHIYKGFGYAKFVIDGKVYRLYSPNVYNRV
ncbi:hypothetical protein [Dethiothermospora halolimnae]|uniref:hypothetical protein n=1 Tax=Dethiothermospora halolimnae TaxID=3114390 RepID=UPI003CCC33A2